MTNASSQARRPLLWNLRLDGEEELALHREGRATTSDTPPFCPGGAKQLAAFDALASEAGSGSGYGLLRSGDRVIGRTSSPVRGGAAFVAGVAWCPTPWALAELAAHGVEPPPSPGIESLIAANARESFADLDPLPWSAVCSEIGAVEQHLRRSALARSSAKARAPAWLLRASLCTAGGARKVAERPDEKTLVFAERHLRRGPIHVTPLVDIVSEYALHGWLTADGELRRGEPVRTTQSGGSWRGAERALNLSPRLKERLVNALAEVAQRLHAMNYFGPFGIDAFEWEDQAGRRHLHAPSEVNARYTMSFSVGAPRLIGLRQR